MGLSPPDPAAAGQPYYLEFQFLNYVTGTPVDPASLTLDLTYGKIAGTTADIAGPFTYTGSSVEASDTIWRTGTGAYTFRWDVPTSGLVPGVYVATWTSIYGVNNDVFQVEENFPIVSGAPFTAVPAGDTGFWTGSLSYQPSWAASPFTIPFGSVDGNGVAWILESVDGWDGPPAVGQVIQRSADHGGWPSAQFYGPRLLTLTVMASAPTQAARDVAKTQLVQAVPISDLATFVYDEPVPKQVYFRQNASAKIGMKFPTLVDVVFTIPVVCPGSEEVLDGPAAGHGDAPGPGDQPADAPGHPADRVPRLGTADRHCGDLRQQRDVRDTAGRHRVGADQ